MNQCNMNRIGKKTQEWNTVRRNLKQRFSIANITSCEVRLPQCWGSYCLYFSHTKRRADIKTQEELERVVLACAACATAAHGMGKVGEEKFLEEIIAKREVQP
jgi:hypothetical protein